MGTVTHVPDDPSVTVLYDRGCGFCRWSLAWLLQRDPDRRLVPVAIQSPEGDALLEAAGVPVERRLLSAHAHRAGDPPSALRSGGDAAALVAPLLRGVSGRTVAAILRATPGPLLRTVYGQVAANRVALGRFVSTGRRADADRLLATRER